MTTRKIQSGGVEGAEVVDKLRHADPAAVEYLYDTYFDRIFALVFRLVDRDQKAAEDVVQETFLAALRSQKSYRGESSPYTWLCSIAYHKAADYQRRGIREHRKWQQPLDMDGCDPDWPGRAGPSVADMTESVENRELIRAAMAELPEDYRRVLILKYVEDLPVADICRIMRRSPKSVEGLLTRARRALRSRAGSEALSH
ncbi:MAG: RNA polymerase sigma factor [Chloroflexi bacterium]|nr:RNA polymerase sigma factor [Chloroflexota bacterium]